MPSIASFDIINQNSKLDKGKSLKEQKKANLKNIKNFVYHKRHENIYFDKSRKCFMLTENNGSFKISGLKSYMQAIFFPDYEYEKKKGDASSGISNPFEGIERGEIVHEQLEDYFNLNTKDFVEKYPSLHFYTSKTIKSLKEWKLKPLCSEISIWNQNVATKLDGVCTDKLIRFILCEWKTGMDGYFLRGNSDMKGILKGLISNSPLNQALLQLLLTKVIIEREYNIIVHMQYVVHIHKDGVIPYEIPENVLQIKNQIYDYFIQQIIILKTFKQKLHKQNKKKKTKSKTNIKKKTNKKTSFKF